MLTTRNTTQRSRATAAALCVAALLAGCTPPGPRALLEGERLLQQGHAEEAARRLRTAVELLPANAQAWNHLGLALHAAHQVNEAGEAYAQALRLDRNLAVAHYNLGCLWFENGDATRAVDSLRTHVGLSPQSFDGWLRLGQAQLRLKQWEQADRSFSSALKLAPRDPEALNGLGVTHQQRRHPREAWQCFTNAIGQNPRFAPAWLNLGVAAHQAGARPQAIQAYRQYATLRPDAARSLGLEAVVQQLEGASRPPGLIPPVTNTIITPVAPPLSTNVRPAVPLPPRASVTPTNSPGPAVVAAPTNAPAQPRSPPHRTEVERPATPTNAVETAVAKVTPSSEAPTLDTSRPASTVPPPAESPSPAPLRETASTTNRAPQTPTEKFSTLIPDRSEPASPPITLASSTPPAPSPASITPAAPKTNFPTPPPVTVTVTPKPVAALVSANTTTNPPPPEIPAQPVFEVVQLTPPAPLAANLRDEPAPGSTPEPTPKPTGKTPGPLASAKAGSPSDPPPLVRPVAAQHPADSADKRSLWSRANPMKWFGSEKDEPVSASPKVPADSVSDEERSRWRWANPMAWFKGDGNATNAAPESVSPTRIEPVRRIPGPAMADSATNAPGSTPPRPAVETASLTEPAAPAIRRYSYQRPAPPLKGDTTAAEPLVAEAVREHSSGRLDSAVKLYGDAVRLDPGSFEAQSNLATALLQSGQAPKALPVAETALALRPGSTSARLNFALALDSAGYPMDAVTEAARIAGTQDTEGTAPKSDRVAAHLLLGNLYSQKLGQPGKARQEYLKVLELDPDHPQNQAIRRWLVGRK